MGMPMWLWKTYRSGADTVAVRKDEKLWLPGTSTGLKSSGISVWWSDRNWVCWEKKWPVFLALSLQVWKRVRGSPKLSSDWKNKKLWLLAGESCCGQYEICGWNICYTSWKKQESGLSAQIPAATTVSTGTRKARSGSHRSDSKEKPIIWELTAKSTTL